jgi:hypothetical protein
VDEKWMNKGGDKPKKKFVISHSTYDDLPKKHWVDEKWMNREPKNKTTKCCNFTLHDG